MNHEDHIIQAEDERFEERLEQARFEYRRKHGYSPPAGWADFHRARFNRYRAWLRQPANTIWRCQSDYFRLFVKWDNRQNPGLAKAALRPVVTDDDFGPMEYPGC